MRFAVALLLVSCGDNRPAMRDAAPPVDAGIDSAFCTSATECGADRVCCMHCDLGAYCYPDRGFCAASPWEMCTAVLCNPAEPGPCKTISGTGTCRHSAVRIGDDTVALTWLCQ